MFFTKAILIEYFFFLNPKCKTAYFFGIKRENLNKTRIDKKLFHNLHTLMSKYKEKNIICCIYNTSYVVFCQQYLMYCVIILLR